MTRGKHQRLLELTKERWWYILKGFNKSNKEDVIWNNCMIPGILVGEISVMAKTWKGNIYNIEKSKLFQEHPATDSLSSFTYTYLCKVLFIYYKWHGKLKKKKQIHRIHRDRITYNPTTQNCLHFDICPSKLYLEV